ncbi:MAG: tRNA epoxyqueuosine(34) reductase QueG [Acidobacteriota bacterium]
MTDRAFLAEQLRTWAVEEGFTRAGVASLVPSAHGEVFRRWLARGDHADMQWMERRIELREDPRRLVPGAQSALVVALQYFPLEGGDEPSGDLWPKVARYARGRDYHDIMSKQLKRLARRIEAAYPGTVTRPYVDTGPVLERELAARAGIGSFGKNTNLLERRWGSYFLLGELFLSLDLEPDAPLDDPCGRCTRCLDACPTGALPEPYRLDARRCIAYWTIEHRGDLPTEVRPWLGEWVFGCDICQEVCPHNHKVLPGTEPRLRLPPERAELDLEALLGLEVEEFRRRFIKSPMKRTKLEGLKRNAAVVMGNRGDTAYVPALGRALDDASPVVRKHAAWALGRIGGAAAIDRLIAAHRVEIDDAVRSEIDDALEGLGG